MSLWPRLVSAAILGTERKKPEVEVSDGSLGEIVSKIEATSGSAESGLLGMAATLFLYNRCGAVATRVMDLQKIDHVEDARHRAPTRAEDILRQILADGSRRDLAEWLGLADERGLRPPEELIPELLDAAADRSTDRQTARRVAGPVGEWLAVMNPRWAFAHALGESDQEIWETGERVERADALERSRSIDPEKGLQMLASTWDQETAEDRALFLEQLEHGLSTADEPFIEGALDDRRAEVRTVALRLLGHLPGSQLIQRMIERADPLIELATAGMLRRKGRLEVKPPAAYDKSMTRDGIRKKPPTGIGEGGWWLYQIVAAIPPSHWSERWGRSPGDLFEAVEKSEWATVVRHAWIIAAFEHSDTEWLRAIWNGRMLESWQERHLTPDFPIWEQHTPYDLVKSSKFATSQHFIEELLLPLLAARPTAIRDDISVGILLDHTQGMPGEKLSAVIVESIRRLLKKGDAGTPMQEWAMQERLKELAARLTPSLWRELDSALPADRSELAPLQSAIEQLIAKLRFREEMHQAFEENLGVGS